MASCYLSIWSCNVPSTYSSNSTAISWPVRVITTGISDVHFADGLRKCLKLELIGFRQMQMFTLLAHTNIKGSSVPAALIGTCMVAFERVREGGDGGDNT